MGISGVFSRDQSLEDENFISPYFSNPFNPSHKIFWLVCPSHQVKELFYSCSLLNVIQSLQLKNMINALFSSRWPDGTKHFQLEGVEFGWQTIIDMYSRECDRRNKGAARMIPRLREVHILRDSWTKLNVHPAKIMQVLANYSYVYTTTLIRIQPRFTLNANTANSVQLNPLQEVDCNPD